MESKQVDGELASALMQWVKSFDTAGKIQTWQDLEDGASLWRILQEIDSSYFAGDLPEADRKEHGATADWIPRWQNLKHISRLLSAYIRDECDVLPNLSSSPSFLPDLKAIATSSATSQPEIIKLVKTVLLVAMYSENSDQRNLIVEKVGLKGASAIADAIQEMEELDSRLGSMQASEAETSEAVEEEDEGSEVEDEKQEEISAYERDPELEREEKLIAALQEKRKLEEQLSYLREDLQESEEKRRALEEELQESKFGIDNRRRRTTMDEENFQQLNLQADRDRDYIAKLETDLSEAQTTLETQQRQLNQLKSDAQSKQDLRDELQLLRTERDDLLKKTKANENLRKKIQALQESEKTSTQLRRDLADAKERLEETDRLRERLVQLERVNEENAKTIANGEQEIFDQKTAKEQLKYELKVLGQRFEQTREMLQGAQETIREMEDRGSKAGDEEDAEMDLDAELNAEPGASSAADEAEKKARRKSAAVPVQSADSIVLQQNLERATNSIARLEQRCLDLLQENLGLKSEGEGDSPFQHQVKRLETLETDLEDAKAKYALATGEAADLRRLLEMSESQAYGERQSSSDAAITANRDRQTYIEELQTQLREHRSLLRHALLDTTSLLKMGDELRRSEEFKIVRMQVESVRDASISESSDVEKIVDDASLTLTNRIESARSLASQHGTIISTLQEKMNNLQTELQKAKASSPPTDTAPADKEAKEQIEILKRENKLMASAWYDLTGRLQSNTVLLTRRSEAPRSWLGRQRGVVGGLSAKR